MSTLIIKQKDKDEIRQQLVDDVVTLGRVKANTITITGDTAISRQHCKFEQIDDKVYVTDMGSSNGTRVNGKDAGVERIRLKDGDRVQIGSTIITVEDVPGPKVRGRHPRPGGKRGATTRADGTVFADGYVKCGKCGSTIDTKRRKPGQKVGCVRCRSIFVLPE